MRLQLLVFEGLDELDVVGPYEVLRLAARLGARFEVELVSLGAPAEITAQNGLHLRATSSLDVEHPPDVLIVPGGGWIDRAANGAWAEVQRGVIPPVIARVHEKGAIVAAVCTGSMLLAAAGILRGRAAVTHHRVLDELKAVAGVEVVSARVVDDGDVVTAGGVTSGIDLALWLVERFADARIARAVETILEFERRGTVWRRPAAR